MVLLGAAAIPGVMFPVDTLSTVHKLNVPLNNSLSVRTLAVAGRGDKVADVPL